MTPKVPGPAAVEDHHDLAIVGVGPRGSYALECFLSVLEDAESSPTPSLLLFDDAEFLGAGPVYAVNQPDSNWINVTERVLELEPRSKIQFNGILIPAFPGYHEWDGFDKDEWPGSRPDQFPPRGRVGRYLNERASSLIDPLLARGVARLVHRRVNAVRVAESGWELEDTAGETYRSSEVLLTVGHQDTECDEQILEWREHTEGCDRATLVEGPYPVGAIVDAARGLSDGCVALRGYGLAMVDVVRAVALEHGRFREPEEETDAEVGTLAYELAPDAPCCRLAPFSLDGLPLSPKPLTADLDAHFEPTDEELSKLELRLGDSAMQMRATDGRFLMEAVASVASRVALDHPSRRAVIPTEQQELESLIIDWLSDDSVRHAALTDHDTRPREAIEALIEMATGQSPVSLDYIVGQVWRHSQHALYAGLSYNCLGDEALNAVVSLDERIKRYSFGPPVLSMRQLLALEAAGILTLDHVKDPEIRCDVDGWTLVSGDLTLTAGAMVDCMLDNPELKKVDTALIKGLLQDDLIQPAHDELGVQTRTNAVVQSALADGPASLAVLGRLAKGTVVGVDAILMCFGDRPVEWAKSAHARLSRARSEDAETRQTS